MRKSLAQTGAYSTKMDSIIKNRGKNDKVGERLLQRAASRNYKKGARAIKKWDRKFITKLGVINTK